MTCFIGKLLPKVGEIVVSGVETLPNYGKNPSITGNYNSGMSKLTPDQFHSMRMRRSRRSAELRSRAANRCNYAAVASGIITWHQAGGHGCGFELFFPCRISLADGVGILTGRTGITSLL
jgi:hypothetical protein